MPSRLSLVPHAVVLCGPQGAPALHPLPGPPALLHIGNEPAVGYLLRALEAAGTRSAILVSLSLAFCVRGEAGGLRALLNVAAMQAPMYGLYARGVRGVDSDGGRLVTRREQAHAFRRPTHPIPVPSSILLTLTHATVSLSSRTHTHTHTHTHVHTDVRHRPGRLQSRRLGGQALAPHLPPRPVRPHRAARVGVWRGPRVRPGRPGPAARLPTHHCARRPGDGGRAPRPGVPVPLQGGRHADGPARPPPRLTSHRDQARPGAPGCHLRRPGWGRVQAGRRWRRRGGDPGGGGADPAAPGVAAGRPRRSAGAGGLDPAGRPGRRGGRIGLRRWGRHGRPDPAVRPGGVGLVRPGRGRGGGRPRDPGRSGRWRGGGPPPARGRGGRGGGGAPPPASLSAGTSFPTSCAASSRPETPVPARRVVVVRAGPTRLPRRPWRRPPPTPPPPP